MAVKKSTKAGTKAAPKKKAAPRASAAATAAKAPAAKAAPKKKAAAAAGATPAAKAAPKKKAAPVKLTDKQVDLLKRINDTKGAGYFGGKGEAKTLESLQTKKLIKRGKKDKEKGYSYSVSKAGEKHLGSASSAAGA